MYDIDCELERMYSHLEDKSLGTAVRDYLGDVQCSVRTPPNVGGDIP